MRSGASGLGNWFRTRADGRIFLPSPPIEWTASVVLATCVSIALATALSIGRLEHALDTIYAEDGEIFLQGALDDGLLRPVFESYAGYMHLVPRLIAEIASQAPTDWYALAVSGAAALAAALIAAVTYRATAAYISSTPLRLLAAAAFVLVPVGQEEVFSSPANLHWFLMPAMVWVLLARPDGRFDVVLQSIVLLAGAASDPLTLVIAPLAAWRWLTVPDRMARVPIIAYAVGLAFELVGTMVSDGEREGLGLLVNPVKVGLWFATHVVGATLLGSRLSDDPASIGAVVAAGLGLFALAALAWLTARRFGWGSLTVPGILFAAAAAFYAAPVTLSSLATPRYAFPAAVMLVSSVAVLVDLLLRERVAGRAQRTALLALALVAGVAWASNYRVDVRRNDGPTWSDAVEDARSNCTTTDEVAVPITPEEGWVVRLSCRELDD